MKLAVKIIFGLVIFVLAFVYFTPASMIHKFLPNDISISGLSGTVWNGNLETIVVDKIGIHNAKWSSNPLNLLTGNLKTDISINSNNLKGNFETIFSSASKIRAEDILLNGDLSLLLPYFEKYGLTISGQFDADFTSLEVDNGLPKEANGIFRTYDTNVLGIFPLHLGDITSVFEQQSNSMFIKISNNSGEVDLAGAITIDPLGNYLADLTLSKNSNTPDQVLQAMELFGTKIGESTVKLTRSGQLSI